jgi:type I restriction enzyme, S subunit
MSNLSEVMNAKVCLPKAIPNDWSWESLDKICKPKQWKTISSSDMTDSGYPVFGANGFIGYYSEYNHAIETIAITCRGNTCGTINRIPAMTYITGNSMALEGIDEENVLRGYLYYALKYRTVTDAISGSAQPQITAANLKHVKFPVAPLPEQKKIAAILTSVDDVIEKTQAQIDKLKDLKTGMMQELLTRGAGVDGKPHTEFKDSPVGRIPKGWVIEIFGDVFDLKNGVNKGKEFFGNGVPIISYRNVYDGNGIYDYMLSNKVEMTEGELERFKVRKGDVFITRTSETPDEIGFTNVYLGDLDNVVFNGFVIRARQKTDIFDCDYSKYAFQADYMRQQMIHSSKFTTRAGISGESLSLLKVIVPPLIEQQKIGKAISSVDARINSLIKLRDSKSSLKKALMQDLLTGKVRVKVEG